MALVEGDPEAGGGARYALVKARDGAVLADGDEVFGERAAAVAAFERSRSLGWTLYATPALLDSLEGAGDIAPLDPAALDSAAAKAGTGIVLAPAGSARGGSRRLALMAVGIAILAALAGAWIGRDALLGLLFAPEEAAEPAGPVAEPTVSVTVDGGALIAACRQALIEHSPFIPAWRIERIECAARFSDSELTGLRPELAGRGVLLVRWRLADGHADAMQRRVAEAHLARWHAGSVVDGRAWAAAPLAPVLRVADAAAPAFLDLRRAVDRAFGARGSGVGYARGAEGAWAVRIDDPGPLSRLGPLAGGIDGLEITELSRGAGGRWRLEGRAAAPERMTEARFRSLGGDAAVTGARIGSQEGKEVRHATRLQDDR